MGVAVPHVWLLAKALRNKLKSATSTRLLLSPSPVGKVPRFKTVLPPEVNTSPLALRLRACACFTSTSYVPGTMLSRLKVPLLSVVRVTGGRLTLPAGVSLMLSGSA